MNGKSQQDERRKFRRWKIFIPLALKMWPTATYPTSPTLVNVETNDISLEGLSVVKKIRVRLRNGLPSIHNGEESSKLISLFLLNNKTLELGINILPKGGSIKGIGKVMWYDRCLREESYYLRAGILIKQMENEHKEKWLEFLRTVTQIQGKYLV